jgi:predicted nucleotidyltransferase
MSCASKLPERVSSRLYNKRVTKKFFQVHQVKHATCTRTPFILIWSKIELFLGKGLSLQDRLMSLERAAMRIARNLSQVPNVRSIILVGSCARGDISKYSDVDLLLITEAASSRSEIMATLPPEERIKELSLLPYPCKVFTRLYEEGSLFVAHALKEGRVLHDDGYYAGLKQTPFKVSKKSLLLQWKMLKQRIRLYDDLSIYGRVLVDCFSHLYSITKNIAVISLAMNGDFSFDKKKALRRFKKSFPQLRGDVSELVKLRAFSLIWSKGASIKEPFPPVDCREKAEICLNRLRRIVSVVELHEFGTN